LRAKEYGITAYKAWHSKRDDGFDQMKAYRNEHYAPPPLALPHQMMTPMSLLDQTTSTTPIMNPSRYGNATLQQGGVVLDELNMFLMYIHGITPEMAAERNQKEIEREEQAAQKASRSKVMEWRNHLDVH
jgi:hypothetical protein